MNRFRRYSYLVLGVSVLLAVAGVTLYVLLPPRMHERAREMASERARATAQYLAAYTTKGLVDQDPSQIKDAAQLVRLDRDLKYAVVVGADGIVLASTIDSTSVGHSWSRIEDQEKVLRATVPVVYDERLAATVEVGLSLSRYEAGAARDEMLILMFSIFLVLLGGGVGIGVWQLKALRQAVEEWQKRHRNLRMHTGSLQSSVKEHRQTEQALKKSEEKYRSLFESTMEQAMRDLEALNRDLERQKVDLEHEVVVRKRAEAALRRYAERLTVMNGVERTMLEGGTLSDSVEHALRRLRELVSAAHVSLINIDGRTGAGRVEGVAAADRIGERACERMARMDFGGFAQAGGATRYVPSISEREHQGALEQLFLADGIEAYAHVPLVIEEEIVGVLNLASERSQAFSEEDLGIARDVADLLAIGIRQDRMERERVRYEAELIAAKERAEDMARLKSAFLTNMSHEIRTPITGIMGFTQVLHDEVPEALKEFTGLIGGAAQRLLNTINSVLELARLESSGGRVQTTVVNVGDTVKEACLSMKTMAQRKGLPLRVHIGTENFWAELDAASVERIVANLLDNAVKFTEKGAIDVRVSGERDRVTVEVEDSGVGIAEEFLPRLFEEFRQEQMDANREHEGSGLGLAISKKLTDLMGGTITVESRKGKGSTFRVSFVRLTVAEQENREPRGQIIVVTDVSAAAEAAERLIGAEYRVLHATDVAAAHSLLKSSNADAVLVDVNTEGVLEGDWVAETRAHRPQLRLLAMASSLLPENIDDVLSIGFDRFIVAPFEGDSLANALSGQDARADRPARTLKTTGNGLTNVRWVN